MKNNPFSLFVKNQKDRAATRPSALRIENLEDRQLLSVTDLGALAAANSNESAQYSATNLDSVEPISLNALNTTASSATTVTYSGRNAVVKCDVTPSTNANSLSFKYFIATGRNTNVFATDFDLNLYKLSKLSEGEKEVTVGNMTTLSAQVKGTSFSNLSDGYYNFKITGYYDDSKVDTVEAPVLFGNAQLRTPENLKAAYSNGTATLTWDSVPSYGNNTKYNVTYKIGDGEEMATTVSGTTLTIPNVVAGSACEVSVVATWIDPGSITVNDDATLSSIPGGGTHSDSDAATLETTLYGTFATSPAINSSDATSTSTTLSLSWGAVEGATGYKVRYVDAGSGAEVDWTNAKTLDVTDGTTKATITGLASSTNYLVKVDAVADGYNASSSEAITLTTKLAAPTGFYVDGMSASSHVVTCDLVDGASSYEFYYSKDGGEPSTPVTGYLENSYVNYTFDLSESGAGVYTFYAVAVDADGAKSDPATVTAVIGDVQLAAPTNLKAEYSETDGKFTLNWDPVSCGLGSVKYAVTYKIGEADEQTAENIEGTSWSIDNIELGTECVFKVAARWVAPENYNTVSGDAVNVGAYSDSDAVEITQYASAALAEPDNVRAAAYSYIDENNENNNCYADMCVKVAWDAVTTTAGGNAVAETATVKYKVACYDSDSQQVGNVQFVDGTEAIFTGLTPDTGYKFKVTAYVDGSNVYGESGTFEIAGSTAKSQLQYPYSFGTSVAENWVHLQWGSGTKQTTSGKSVSASDVAYEIVCYRINGDGSEDKIENPTIEEDTESIVNAVYVKNLTPNTRYKFTLQAVNATGSDKYNASEIREATVTTEMSTLDFAGDVTATLNGNSATVTWDAVTKTTSNLDVASDVTYTVFAYTVVNDFQTESPALTMSGVSETSYTFDNLDAATTYRFMVAANADGYEGFSQYSTSDVNTAHATPSNLAITTQINGDLYLFWNNTSGATEFVVYYTGSNGLPQGMDTVDGTDKTRCSCNFGKLSDGAYTFYVQALKPGDYPVSAVATYGFVVGSAQLDAPENFNVDLNGKTATITWDPVESVLNNVKYEVSYSTDGENFTKVPQGDDDTETSRTISGLAANTEYTFKVTASSAKLPATEPTVYTGEAYTDSVVTKTVKTDKDPLAKPINVTVTGRSDTSVTITWDAVPNATKYRVSYTTANGVWFDTTSEQFYEFTGLKADTEYTFNVVAIDDSGNYADSEAESVTEKTALGAYTTPTGIKISGTTSDSVTVAWNALDGASEYVVSYKLASDSEWTDLVNDETTKTATSRTISELAANTKYDIKVVAKATGYKPSEPATISATTEKAELYVPGNFAIVENGLTDTSVKLDWDDVASAAGGYTVEASDKVQYVISWIDNDVPMTATASESEYTVTGLTARTGYEFTIYATSANFADSSTASVGVKTLDPKLATPVGIIASDRTDVSLTVTWTAVENAKTYTVSVNGEKYDTVGTNTITIDRGLTANTDYAISVVADAVAEGEMFRASDAGEATLTTDKIAVGLPTICKETLTTAGVTTNNISLTWDGVDKVAGYRVTIVGPDVDTTVLVSHTVAIGTNAGRYHKEFRDLTPNTEYKITITSIADTAKYEDYKDAISATYTVETLKETLNAPTGFAQTDKTDSSVTLTWSAVGTAKNTAGDVSNVLEGSSIRYKVTYAVDGEEKYVDTDLLTAEITGLAANTTYDFKVAAYDQNGNYNNAAAATCSATTDLATLAFAEDAEVTQTDTMTAYGAYGSVSDKVKISWDGIAEATSYVVSYRESGTENAFVSMDPTSETNCEITGLKANTTYDIQIVAQNTGAYYDSATPLTGSATTDKEKLATPRYEVTSFTDTSITLTWNAVDNATSYYVKCDANDGHNNNITVNEGTTVEITGLTPNTKYELGVQAIDDNDGYWQSNSWIGSATTDMSTLAFAEYAVLTQAPVAGDGSVTDSVEISWHAVENASSYVVSYRVKGSEVDFTTLDPQYISGTTAVISGLDASTTYEIQVVAQATGYHGSAALTGEATTDMAKLATPTGFEQDDVSCYSATISWTGIETEGASYVVSYKVKDSEVDFTPIETTKTSVEISNLDANTTYEIQVVAQAEGYHNSVALTGEATTKKETLKAPTDVAVSSYGLTFVTLTWSDVAEVEEGKTVPKPDPLTDAVTYAIGYDENGVAIGVASTWPIAYKITYTDGENTEKVYKFKGDFDSTVTKQITGLQPFTKYKFNVSAYGVNYNISKPATVEEQTDAKVTGFAIKDRDDDSVTVTWTAVPNATAYDVYVDGELFGEVESAEATIDNLTANTTYNIQVVAKAEDYRDSRMSAEFPVGTDMSTLATPNVKQVALDEGGKVDVSAKFAWSPVDNAESYKVYVNNELVETLGSDVTSYTVTDLDRGTNVVTVEAIAEGFYSAKSAEATATFADLLKEPTNVVQDMSEGKFATDSITIKWDAVENADRYFVYLGNGTQEIQEGTSCTWGGLQPNLTYNFTVKAASANYQFNSAEVPVTATTDMLTLAFDEGELTQAEFTNPGAVTDSVTISWPAASNAESYKVSYRVAGSTDEWDSVTATTNSATLSGLATNTEYEIQVVAQADGYHGSAVLKGAAKTDMTKLAAPTGFEQVGDATASSVSLKWGEVSGATGYTVYYYAAGEGATPSIKEVTTGATSVTIDDLDADTKYSFSVVAFGANQHASNSSISVVATTDMATLTDPSGFVQTAKTPSSVTIDWDDVSGATGYVVTWVVDGVEKTLNVDESSATITGLANETSYAINVVATGSRVYESKAARFDVRTDKETLASPKNLRQTADTIRSVTVAWDRVEYAQKYSVSYMRGEQKVTFVTTRLSCTLPGLEANTEVPVSVTAMNPAYNSSEPATFSAWTDMIYLAEPTGFVQTSATADSATFTWNTVENADEYIVICIVDGVATYDVTSAASYTVTGLAPHTEYDLYVAADASDYDVSQFEHFAVASALESPENFTASNVTANSVDLTWDVVELASCYSVGYSYQGGGFVWETTSDLSYSFGNLTPITDYTFYVKAEADGYWTSEASTVDVTTDKAKLATPEIDGDYVATDNSLSLAWGAVIGATSYDVYVDGVLYKSDLEGTSIVIEKLNANTTYAIKVVAKDVDHYASDAAPLDAATDKAKLAVPTNFAVDGKPTDSSVALKWDAVTGATSYDVYVGDVLYAENVADTSITVSELKANTAYSFSVVAKDGDHYASDKADAIEAKTDKAKLAQPDNITVVSFTSRKATITWDNVDGATSYTVSYGYNGKSRSRTVSKPTVTLMGLDSDSEVVVEVVAKADGYYNSDSVKSATFLTKLPEPSYFDTTGGTPTTLSFEWDEVVGATKYVLTATDASGKVLAKRECSDLSATLEGLPANTSCTVTLVAHTTVNDSDPATITIKTEAYPSLGNIIGLTLVGKPTTNTATIKWDAVANADSYVVSYMLDGVKQEFSTDKTEYVVEGLKPGSTYSINVVAKGDERSDSDPASINVATEKTKLGTPIVSQTGDEAVNSARISWEAVPGADGYYVLYDSDRFVTSDTYYDFEGLPADSSIDVHVVAYADNCKDSDAGNCSVSTIVGDPSNLVASSVKVDSFKVTWTAAEGNNVTYKVTVATRAGVVVVDSEIVTELEYTATGLNANTVYDFYVVAVGATSESNAVSIGVATSAASPKLALPSISTTSTSNSIKASWNAVDNAVRYLVQIHVKGEDWPAGSKAIRVENATEYEFTGLEAGVTYEVRVNAIADGVDYKNSGYIFRTATTASDAVAEAEEEFGDDMLDLLAFSILN